MQLQILKKTLWPLSWMGFNFLKATVALRGGITNILPERQKTML